MTTILDVPGSNPSNFFTPLLQGALVSTQALEETAARIVDTVTASPRPARALWELWDAFFTAAVNSSSHNSHLALLDALRSHPATRPNNVRTGSDDELQLRSYIQSDGNLHWVSLPRFSAQWRDVHDILEAWRDWDGVRASGAELSGRGDEYFLRFCQFSAILLKNGEHDVHPVNVFYASKNVLERHSFETHQPKPHRMASEQLWALDVRVTATWLRDGGCSLWETDSEGLAQGWKDALEEKTELWTTEDGLTRNRWRLWGDRLRALSTDASLDEATKMTAAEAANVVADLLERGAD